MTSAKDDLCQGNVMHLAAGLSLTFIGLAPIQLLFLGSVFGGLATPVALTLMMLVARDRSIMGERRISRGMAIAGYAIAVMAIVILASLAFLVQTFLPGR